MFWPVGWFLGYLPFIIPKSIKWTVRTSTKYQCSLDISATYYMFDILYWYKELCHFGKGKKITPAVVGNMRWNPKYTRMYSYTKIHLTDKILLHVTFKVLPLQVNIPSPPILSMLEAHLKLFFHSSVKYLLEILLNFQNIIVSCPKVSISSLETRKLHLTQNVCSIKFSVHPLYLDWTTFVK